MKIVNEDGGALAEGDYAESKTLHNGRRGNAGVRNG